MGIEDVIDTIAVKSRAVPDPCDYVKDGLLYCGKCNTRRERVIEIMGERRVVGMMCKCREEKYNAEREEERKMLTMNRIAQLRSEGIQDKSLAGCRFDTAEKTDVLEKCKRYADRWEDVSANNMGILLYGPPGGGKTFAAACVANQLLEKQVPVMMTSLTRVLNSSFDKSGLISMLRRYPLLVLDDLGVERSSEYALETVYTVIDERYKSKKPLILTTNLDISEIMHPADMAYARIYDRILEMCTPVAVPAGGIRKEIAKKKKELAADIFGGKR